MNRSTPKAEVIIILLAAYFANAVEPCRIEIVEQGGGWPVPLVELDDPALAPAGSRQLTVAA